MLGRFLAQVRLSLPLTVGLALAAGCMPAGIDDWDSNGDGVVSRAEFRSGQGTRTLFKSQDRDRDGLLSPREFAARGHGTLHLGDRDFTDWDVNDDDWVDESETLDGYFDSYDDDGDGVLTGAERDRMTGELERYRSFD